jgi:UDP-N-acetylglucosamine 2-epimerase (non-hydrolysing)
MKVAVFTGTRAEYGLLRWLMYDIQRSDSLELQLIVSGTHWAPSFGETWKEIVSDGFRIDERVEMLLASNTSSGVIKSMGLGMIGFADALERLRPNAMVVLGDRFETLAMTQACAVMRIPVVHIHGGEITEGAYDDAFRHAITKMSTLHFTSTSAYRQRVIQMGEAPDTVFHVGALGLDHLKRSGIAPLHSLQDSMRIDLSKPFALATYHPVTAAREDPAATAQAMLNALQAHDLQVILTYPNADNGGQDIIAVLEAHASAYPDHVQLVPSLGSARYLTAMANASVVIGNSSSGIIEAPAFHIPTVNIGIRQQGRLAAASVIHCAPDQASISHSIEKAMSSAFRDICQHAVNPYGAGDASSAVLRQLESWTPAPLKKFFDLEVDE